MQQDKQLMDSLLENQKGVSYINEGDLNPESEQITEIRVVNAKYKVYVMILILLGVIIGTTYLPDAKAKYDSAIRTNQNKTRELAELKQKFEEYATHDQERQQIENNSGSVIGCVNRETRDYDEKYCKTLPPLLSGDLNVVISYLQMGNLGSEKMGVDEQKVLKNLDRYLTRNTPGDALSVQNGTIWGIHIGEPQVVKHISVWGGNNKREFDLNKVALEAQIAFDNKDDLITFVDNIEQYIITEKEDRILYTIDEVTYDIMQYDEKQTAKVALTAYYFK